ncbi:response regulator receiver domain-containing protein [Novosphingobium kunmingense]|uniref:Response regulator receiver domain-containing protein n=1 Tax=Novosphingobium kunmingense TaxID=1211806 RepID=A0A2N0H6H8_9SPHN|nr:response regulator receiver domain-containing protein [Novosphingobium kunmingense]
MQFWAFVSSVPAILVVDDEVLIAWNLAMDLESMGAEVIGPFHSLDDALAGVADVTPTLAVLDINLHDRKVWPLAEVLSERGVPMLFVSADIDHGHIAARFPSARKVQKPISAAELKRHVSEMTASTLG